MHVDYIEFVVKENLTTADSSAKHCWPFSTKVVPALVPDQCLISNHFLLPHTTAPKIAKIVLKRQHLRTNPLLYIRD